MAWIPQTYVLYIFINGRALVIFHIGSCRIGPWAIFPQYVDRAFLFGMSKVIAAKVHKR